MSIVERRSRSRAMAFRELTSRDDALLALIAPTTVLADSRPTALLALRALTTVLADSLPTALLALSALTTVRTSTAHLALRAVLHPVLAWPLRVRGFLPLHALLGRLLSPCIFVIDITDIRNGYPDFRPPNRRHPHPRGRRAPK